MKLSKRTRTEFVIEKIAKLKGRNQAERGDMLWVANALANRDTKLQRRSARITHKMLRSLKKAFPDVDPQLIGDITADLDSLWDTGQKLNKELERLFHMRFPQHRQHLREFLAFIEATQIDMVEFWIGNLRQRVPKLVKDLDRQERAERRRARRR